MKTLFVVIFLILINQFDLFSKMEWQNPKPTGQTLRSVCFIDENTGWICGHSNSILKTTDGGESWVSKNEGTEVFLSHADGLGHFLYDIYFINKNTGITVGSQSSIYRTIDGGENWTKIDLPIQSDFYEIGFVDEYNGWLVGTDGYILKTTDAGESWSINAAKLVSNFLAMDIINDSTIWATGDVNSYKTTNNGQDWVAYPIPQNTTFVSTKFLNDSLGWSTGYDKSSFGFIYKTTDGGMNWIKQNSIKIPWTSELIFEDELNGYVVGDKGLILRTTNGGENWKETSVGAYSLYSIEILGNGQAVAIGDDGTIFKTVNNGTSWELKTPRMYDYFSDIEFIDENKGFIVSYNASIASTSDGGKNWELTNTGFDCMFRKLTMLDDQNGYIVGSKNILLTTSNGGKDWEQKYIDTSEKVYDFFFFDKNRILMCGDSGLIKMTKNGGENWIKQESGTSKYLNAIFFLDNNYGWIAGDKETFLRTSNGGLNWENTNATIRNPINLIFFDEKTGWVVSGGSILRTDDGGVNWETQYSSPSFRYIYSLSALNRDSAYAIGSNSTFIKTNDGGKTWLPIPVFGNQSFTALKCVDNKYIWLTGSKGAIIKYYIDSETFVEEKIDKNFNELLISPNPASDYITLNIPPLEKSGLVGVLPEIKIFDIFGNEMHPPRQTSSDTPQEGNLKIDISTLPAGVYFVRIGNKVEKFMKM